jgi:hypothetical protein
MRTRMASASSVVLASVILVITSSAVSSMAFPFTVCLRHRSVGTQRSQEAYRGTAERADLSRPGLANAGNTRELSKVECWPP